MTTSIFAPASRRLLCAVAALAAFSAFRAAQAQSACSGPVPLCQSPIDIVDTPGNPVRYNRNAPRFDDVRQLSLPWTFTLTNNVGADWCHGCRQRVDEEWGTLKASAPESKRPQIVFGGVRYALAQFHFHAPAEHLINQKAPAAMEIHFVFDRIGAPSCSRASILVIGERVLKGAPNQELEKIFGLKVLLPKNYRSPPVTIEGFVVSNVLTGLNKSYRYSGSLTAPADLKNCPVPPGNPDRQLETGYFPQVVSWVMLNSTITMSAEQIDRFRELFPHNSRKPQPIRDQGLSKTFQ